jgi:hypothetical protein
MIKKLLVLHRPEFPSLIILYYRILLRFSFSVTQHNTEQERTQPTNSNTYAHQEDVVLLVLFSTQRERTQPTNSNTYAHLEDVVLRVLFSTQRERTQPTNSNTHAHREDLYINNISNNRRHQFPRPIILIPDDDNIARNM